MSDTPLTLALAGWRTARKAWSDKSTHLTDTQTQFNGLINADAKPADYDQKLALFREELAVTAHEIAVMADDTRNAHSNLKTVCIREALKTFMVTNGATLTDAMYPFLKGSEGMEPALNLLHEALLSQIATRQPQVLTDYNAAMTEAGINLEEAVWKNSGDNYTPAQHKGFVMRREALDKLNSSH